MLEQAKRGSSTAQDGSQRIPLLMTAHQKSFTVPLDHAAHRLDQFLASHLPETSRVRVQQLISQGKVLVDGKAPKPSLYLRGGEKIQICGEVERPPLRAIPEEIPLDVVYEDADLAVINKPAGMMVHAGAGATDADRNRATLVNALPHRFPPLSQVGVELRPGIVHRLDKETSGLIVVPKNTPPPPKLPHQLSTPRAPT